MVAKTHIDFLVTAGLRVPRHSPLRWLWPDIDTDEQAMVFQRGEPWGPDAIRLMHERTRELRLETAGYVGAMLWAENRRSVDHRYDETELEAPYIYEPTTGSFEQPLAWLVVLNATRGYAYQSCEHPGWYRSQAKAFIGALEEETIRRLTQGMPGRHVTTRHIPGVESQGRR